MDFLISLKNDWMMVWGKILSELCPVWSRAQAYKLQRMSGGMAGVELENSPTGPLRPPLNKLIIEVEMKILEKDMAISSYFRPKFRRTNLLKFE